YARVGEARLSWRAGRPGDGEAVGGDLRHFTHHGRRSCRRLARARRAVEAARRYAERKALLRDSLQIARRRDGSARGPGRSASVGWWRNDRRKWHLLPAQHPNGGVLHHAAQGPRRRHRARLEAALAPRHPDREYSLPL